MKRFLSAFVLLFFVQSYTVGQSFAKSLTQYTKVDVSGMFAYERSCVNDVVLKFLVPTQYDDVSMHVLNTDDDYSDCKMPYVYGEHGLYYADESSETYAQDNEYDVRLVRIAPLKGSNVVLKNVFPLGLSKIYLLETSTNLYLLIDGVEHKDSKLIELHTKNYNALTWYYMQSNKDGFYMTDESDVYYVRSRSTNTMELQYSQFSQGTDIQELGNGYFTAGSDLYYDGKRIAQNVSGHVYAVDAYETTAPVAVAGDRLFVRDKEVHGLDTSSVVHDGPYVSDMKHVALINDSGYQIYPLTPITQSKGFMYNYDDIKKYLHGNAPELQLLYFAGIIYGEAYWNADEYVLQLLGDQEINRAGAAAIVSKIMPQGTHVCSAYSDPRQVYLSTVFKDANAFGQDWFVDAVCILAEHGALQGKNGYLKAGDPVSYDEAIKILYTSFMSDRIPEGNFLHWYDPYRVQAGADNITLRNKNVKYTDTLTRNEFAELTVKSYCRAMESTDMSCDAEGVTALLQRL